MTPPDEPVRYRIQHDPSQDEVQAAKDCFTQSWEILYNEHDYPVVLVGGGYELAEQIADLPALRRRGEEFQKETETNEIVKGLHLGLIERLGQERDRLKALLILAYDERVNEIFHEGLLAAIINVIVHVTDSDVAWAKEQLK